LCFVKRVVRALFRSGFLVGLDQRLDGFVAAVVPPVGLHEHGVDLFETDGPGLVADGFDQGTDAKVFDRPQGAFGAAQDDPGSIRPESTRKHDQRMEIHNQVEERGGGEAGTGDEVAPKQGEGAAAAGPVAAVGAKESESASLALAAVGPVALRVAVADDAAGALAVRARTLTDAQAEVEQIGIVEAVKESESHAAKHGSLGKCDSALNGVVTGGRSQ